VVSGTYTNERVCVLSLLIPSPKTLEGTKRTYSDKKKACALVAGAAGLEGEGQPASDRAREEAMGSEAEGQQGQEEEEGQEQEDMLKRSKRGKRGKRGQIGTKEKT